VLYLEGDEFITPYCCYGDDVDCDLCGVRVVFHLTARLKKAMQSYPIGHCIDFSDFCISIDKAPGENSVVF